MSWYLLITELRFVVMLYSNLDKENADMGHMKCSHRMHLACKPQIPHPWFRVYIQGIRSSDKDQMLIRTYHPCHITNSTILLHLMAKYI